MIVICELLLWMMLDVFVQEKNVEIRRVKLTAQVLRAENFADEDGETSILRRRWGERKFLLEKTVIALKRRKVCILLCEGCAFGIEQTRLTKKESLDELLVIAMFSGMLWIKR